MAGAAGSLTGDRRGRTATRIIRAAALVAVVVVVAAPTVLFPFLGRRLVVDDPLVPSDLIVVLGGDGERIDEGVRLYRNGYGRAVLLTAAEPAGPEGEYRGNGWSQDSSSGMIPWRQKIRRLLAEKPVPESELLLDTRATSTCEEAGAVAEVMESRGYESAIIVSSPYHMLRIRWIFRHLMEKPSTRILLHPVSSSWFRHDNWWTHRWGIYVVVGEYLKLPYSILTC